jgi:hypothetical protein
VSDYTRRPFLASQTDKVILSEPVIFGVVHVNVDGDYDDMPASGTLELAIETESTSSPTIETQQWDAAVDDVSLAGLVAAINDSGSPLYPFVEASAFEGVLRLASKQTGYLSAGNPAYLTIHPQTSGSGVTDLGPLVGFALSPHPTATVRAGDLATSSVRAMTQGNRPGSVFIARGEDRTGENFNRALHRLAMNLDNHEVKLVRDVAVPVALEIPEGSSRFRTDVATGQILGVELTIGFGDDLDSVLATGIYVGGPAHDASIDEISKFYSVLDPDWNEISVVSHDDPGPGDVKDTVVRVGTVAYVPSSPPGSYADSDFELDGSSRAALSNDPTFDSYRSAFQDSSNQPGKATSVITEIVDGATVVCATATFETDLVEAGDIAIISSSGVSSPINHDGEYIVDVVVSETELILRPVDEDSLHLLTDDGLGNIEIRPNGEFETSLYLGFEPPLPRVPSGGVKVILGMQDGFGDMPRDFLLVPAVNSADEVDGWVLKNLFRALNLQGIYDGQGQDKGSGFHADATHRPLTMHSIPEANSPSSVRTGASGTIQAGSNWFTIGTGDEFTLPDVGRSFTFTLSGTEHHDWRISRLIDARTVELVPPPHQIGTVLATGSVSAWEIFDTMLPDFQAAISSVTESARAGGFHHTKVNDGTSSGDLSFAHLEHITEFEAFGSSVGAVSLPTLTAALSGDELTFATVNVDDCPSIFPISAHASSRRNDNIRGGVSFAKLTSGTDVGLYLVYSTRISGSGSIVKLQNLDGTSPSFAAGSETVSFYTLRAGFGVPLFGGADDAGRAALSLFEDGVQKGGDSYALRAGWAGPGAGVLVTANDSSFEALLATATDKGAVGPTLKLVAYAPAYGADVEVRGDHSSSSAQGRGEYGIKIVVETYAHDMSQADSTWSDGLRGAGVQAVQEGLDPAGSFIRRAGGSGSVALLYPATLFVASLGEIDHVGAATGMTLVGDLYLPGHQSSGIYTGGSGTFNELRPGYTDLDVDPPTFWGDGAAWLGGPYLLADVGSVTVADPDYSRFNFDHDFVVDLTRADAPDLDARSPAEIVHMGIRLDLSGTPFGGTILGVWDNGSGVYRMAVRAQTGTSHTTGTHDMKAYGRRWFYSYIDIANYSEIGTGVIAPYQDPGSSQTSNTVSTSSIPAVMPDVDQGQDGAGGLRPLITYDFGDGSAGFDYGKLNISTPDSAGLGDLLSLFSFGQRSGENLADYATAVASNDARDEDAWRNLAGALTSAIDGHVSTARAEIGGPAPFVKGQVPSSRDLLRYEMFWDTDAALDPAISGSAHVEVIPNDGVRTFGGWSYSATPHFSGGGSKIVVSRDRADADAGYVYLYLKLARSIVEGNLAFRVLVDALQFSLVDKNMIVEIVEGTSGSTVLASKTISVPTGNNYDRFVIDFLEWTPEDELSRTDQDVFLRISAYLHGPAVVEAAGDTFMGDGSSNGAPPLWYFRGINVHPLEQGLFKGNLTLQGVLRAAGLRSHTPILGHQVVGPSSVQLLQNVGYGDRESDADTSSYARTTGDTPTMPTFASVTYSPLSDPGGIQEGSNVGTLPMFELSSPVRTIQGRDTQPHSKLAYSYSRSDYTDGGLGASAWGDTQPDLDYGSQNISVLAGVFNSEGSSHDYTFTAGTYVMHTFVGVPGIYDRTDIPGGEVGSHYLDGTLKIPNTARWGYAAFAQPQLMFTGDGGSPGTKGPADADVLHLSNHVGTVVRYYRPKFEFGSFFKVGSGSATVDAYHPYFDPFFYWAYCASGVADRLSDDEKEHLVETYGLHADFFTDVDPDGKLGSMVLKDLVAEADYRVNPDFWDMPGRTGFVIPLDPPHGALLSQLEVNLSFIAADGRSRNADGEYSASSSFSVWRSSPDKDAPASEWVDPTAWREREGVIVRLWRHNLFGEFGAQAPNTGASGVSSPSSGFAELLAETEVDLSSTTATAVSEHFELAVAELAANTARVVDRRRYSYHATVEFYVGCRREAPDGLEIPGLGSDDLENAQRTSPLTWTTAFSGIWPSSQGGFGDWRDSASSFRKGYQKAVAWEGHLVRRRGRDSDSAAAVVYGDSFFSQAENESTWTWGNVEWHTSTSPKNGFNLRRSVYDAQSFVAAGSSPGPFYILPPHTHGDDEIFTDQANTPIASVGFTELVEFPFESSSRVDSDPATPMVKFRGARLTWVTDRLSDGGW